MKLKCVLSLLLASNFIYKVSPNVGEVFVSGDNRHSGNVVSMTQNETQNDSELFSPENITTAENLTELASTSESIPPEETSTSDSVTTRLLTAMSSGGQDLLAGSKKTQMSTTTSSEVQTSTTTSSEAQTSTTTSSEAQTSSTTSSEAQTSTSISGKAQTSPKTSEEARTLTTAKTTLPTDQSNSVLTFRPSATGEDTPSRKNINKTPTRNRSRNNLLIGFGISASVIGVILVSCYFVRKARKLPRRNNFRRLFDDDDDDLLAYESGIHTMDPIESQLAQTSFTDEMDITDNERVIYRPDGFSNRPNSRPMELQSVP